jgi:hypothetical protein
MTREGRFRIVFMMVFAVVGYLLPVLAHTPYLMWHAPPVLTRVLIPIIFLTMQAPVDPDWSEILFFMGPINALLYALVGLFVCQPIINRFRPED